MPSRLLDQAKIKCPLKQVLQGFQLEMRNPSEFGYRYQCIDGKNITISTIVENVWTYWGQEYEGSINFLVQKCVSGI